MTSLHDYEKWLDELDAHLYATATGIRCDYGGGLFFPYASLMTQEAALSVARELALVLLEEKEVNPNYLAKRFFRLVKEKNFPDKAAADLNFWERLFFRWTIAKTRRKMDVEEVFKKHELFHIDLDGMKSISIVEHDNALQMNFLGRGPNIFIRLSRVRDSRNSRMTGPLKVERPAFATWQITQFMYLDGLDVVFTPSFIVFDFPTANTWQDTGKGRLPDWRQHYAMRVALRHHLSDSELSSVILNLKEICVGLKLRLLTSTPVMEEFQSENRVNKDSAFANFNQSLG